MKINKEALDYFLSNYYLDSKCELNYNSIFELLIAVMLSAQTTDKQVNKITPILFNKYKTIKDLSLAKLQDIEEIIKPIGIYKNKAKNIKEVSYIIHNQYNDIVPNNLESLMKLKGVGRKTASVVLIEGFKIPALPVDTHILRVSKRLNICDYNDDAYKCETELRKLISEDKLIRAHHQLIYFGRNVCHAKKPDCNNCPLAKYCTYQ